MRGANSGSVKGVKRVTNSRNAWSVFWSRLKRLVVCMWRIKVTNNRNDGPAYKLIINKTWWTAFMESASDK